MGEDKVTMIDKTRVDVFL